MVEALFVSDIHIASEGDPKQAQFCEFLDRCLALKPRHLFLVGDIFDLWIADRLFFIERYQALVDRLSRLIAAGVQVHYFEGNHDLDLDVFWKKDVGARTYEQAAYFDLAGLKVRVEHGDQMDPDDKGYLFLRWFLRTPTLRWAGRHLPDVLVKAIGERASRASREYTSTVKTSSDERAREVMRRHALFAYREMPFDLLVSGHVHVKEDARLTSEEGRTLRYVGLGTWLSEPVIFRLENSGQAEFVTLEKFLQG